MQTPDEIEQVVLTSEQIAARVAELGAEISRDYRGRDLVLVGVLKGAVVFLSDLMRTISLPHRFDLVRASSYGDGAASSGQVALSLKPGLSLEGCDVLVIEDILDTGLTTDAILRGLRRLGPRSVELCVLLSKQRKRAVEVSARYAGFEIPDAFVVGYGLDYAERFRHLPYVAILKRSVYEA